jgi:prolyl 4-hydroxylase
MSVIVDGVPNLPVARDLARYVQWFDHALDPQVCQSLVASFDQFERLQVRNDRGGINALPSSAWTELNVSKVGDASLEAMFRQQILHYLGRYNAQAQMTLPIPARNRLENLRIKRYLADQGDQFQPHFDALDYTCNRYMVFIWYLNDVSEGGETEFCDLDLRVDARAGRLLMFPPYWMYQHAGLPPRSSDKYIISTYLLF